MTVWPNVSPQSVLEMELIASTTLGAPAASVSFTGISAGYLLFEFIAWILKDGSTGNGYLRFNNDSASNYAHEYGEGHASTLDSARNASVTGIASPAYGAYDASTVGSVVATIGKPLLSQRAEVTQLDSFIYTGDGSLYAEMVGGDWNNTAALISRIDYVSSSGNFATGSMVSLGGARAA